MKLMFSKYKWSGKPRIRVLFVTRKRVTFNKLDEIGGRGTDNVLILPCYYHEIMIWEGHLLQLEIGGTVKLNQNTHKVDAVNKETKTHLEIA